MTRIKKLTIFICSALLLVCLALSGLSLMRMPTANADDSKTVTFTGLSNDAFGTLSNGSAYRMWANMDAGDFYTTVESTSQVTKVLVDGYYTKELKIEPYAADKTFIDFDWAYDGLWTWTTDAELGKSHYFTLLEGTAIGTSDYTVANTFTIKVCKGTNGYHAEVYTPSNDGAVDVFFGDIQRAVVGGSQYPNIETTLRGINQVVYTTKEASCSETTGTGIADGYINSSPWSASTGVWLAISDWSNTLTMKDGETNVGTYNIVIKTQGKLSQDWTTDLSTFGTGHYYTLQKGLTFNVGDVTYRLDETVTFTNGTDGNWTRVYKDCWQSDSEIDVNSANTDTTNFQIPSFSGTVESGKTFIGWENNGKLYKEGEVAILAKGKLSPVCISVSATSGASVRIDDNYGLRFIASSIKADYITERGALLCFTSDLAGEENTAVLEIDGNKSKKVVAEKTVDNNDTIEWRTAITDITVKADGSTLTDEELNTRLTTAISFRAYIIVTYNDSDTKIIYSDYSDVNNSRSMRAVATSALSDTKTEATGDYKYEVKTGVYSKYTAEQYAKLESYTAGTT